MPDRGQQYFIARAIATIAHRNQVDKAGMPYIGHPERVAGHFIRMEDHAPYTITAWLHDVLEDSDITRDDLNAAGIEWTIINYVELLTRKKGQSVEDYYEGIRESHIATQVKLADIADNSDPSRLALLDDATIVRLTKKYAKARALLTV